MKSKEQPVIRLAGHLEKWEWKKLNEISTKVTEKNKDILYSETLTNSAEFGIVSQRDFFEKDISNVKNLNGYYVVRPDDFVYNPRISNYAPVGPIKRNKLNRTGVMSPLYYVFRTRGIDNAFLERYFSSESWHLFMKLNGDSGARSDRFAIKDVVFGEMPIPFPSIEEQKEIGDFFHKLEETIFLHQQELDTLKQTKQGFLQKMFPKDGESVPKLRFPGFSGDWKKCRLADETKIIAGGDVDKSKLSTTGKYPVLANALTNDGIVGYYENEYRIEAPAVTVTGRGDVGHAKARRIDFTPVVRLLAIKSEHDVDFLENAINNHKIVIESTGVPQLTSPQLGNYQIYFPSFDEEKRIGEFFRKINNIIALQQQELNALKQTQKAFLQKMFV